MVCGYGGERTSDHAAGGRGRAGSRRWPVAVLR